MQALRQSILSGERLCSSELERLVSLRTIDDLWSQHISNMAELRSGVHWRSWGGQNPLYEFLIQVHRWFEELESGLDSEIARRLAEAKSSGADQAKEARYGLI